MGGYGSGRQCGNPIAEESKRIDFAWMLREGLAQPGHSRTGTLRWTCNGEPSGNISYTCDMRDPVSGSLELRFTVKRYSTGNSRNHVQHVPLSHSQPHFGGRRWWMHCPITGVRVAKLYVPAGGDIFASRKAWRIGYRSQRVTERDALFERLYRVQRKLGCSEGWEAGIRRPKGMWRKTYEQLEKEYWELDAQCGLAMMQVLARFRGLPSLENKG